MIPILFFDTEIDPRSKKILDIGGVKSDGSTLHTNSIKDQVTKVRTGRFNTVSRMAHYILLYIMKYLICANYGTVKIQNNRLLNKITGNDGKCSIIVCYKWHTMIRWRYRVIFFLLDLQQLIQRLI